MKISCITLTYGRVPHLNECLESFLRQTHPDRELIILNTCPQQTLQGEFPNVRIVNLTERPRNLGHARNLAIEQCTGEIICLLDDDDLALPHFMTVYHEEFERNPEAQWIWLDRQFYLEGGKIRKICSGMANSFAYRKTAWAAVSGYDAVNVGEDRSFVGKITKSVPGSKVAINENQITYLYCWGNGVYHVSGQGDDRPNQPNAWDRSRFHLERLIKRGFVKSGIIPLQPGWRQDYCLLVDKFLGRITPVNKPAMENRPDVCIIELGRFGDIINILPVARLIAERWGKPAFMVNREFASILDGVSYVSPHIFEQNYSQVNQAIALASAKYPLVINAQLWGRGIVLVKKTKAFNLESWQIAGFETEFHNSSLLPVFDRRNLAQEAAIFNKLSNGKPMLLIKVHGAKSAPYRNGNKLEELLRKRFESEYQVVELTSVQPAHAYDLLGLMDRARLLVTIDTMTLHLAAASGIPVVALVNSDPWVSSIPRCNCVAKINYTEANPYPEKVVQLTECALQASTHRAMPGIAEINPPVRKLFHAVERHDGPRDQRKELAIKTWDAIYQKGVIPCHYTKYKRSARNIGDPRDLPYLKDVLEFAMNQAADDDIIFFTNDDNALHPNLAEALRFHVSVYGPCSSQRRELREPIPSFSTPLSKLSKLGEDHIGRDLFAFTKSWLIRNFEKIPDYILGASDWDWGLLSLIRLDYGVITTRKNIEVPIHPAELQNGYVFHQFHPPHWLRPNNETGAASQKHNRLLFKTWAATNLPELKFQQHNRL